MKKFAIAIVALIFCYVSVFSQSGEPASSSIIKDNLVAKPDSSRPSFKRQFPVRSFIWPGAMFAYGVLALNSDGLEDWNQGVKESVWVRHPHKQVTIDNYLQWAPGAELLGLNLSGVRGKHNFKDLSMIYGLTLLIQSSITTSIKHISAETRPNGAGTESFPSGHTANAFSGAELVRLEYNDVSPWYGISGYMAAASTGFLRVYNNKHWTSDVIAGAGVGIASARLAWYLYPIIKTALFRGRQISSLIVPTYQYSVWGLGYVKVF